MSSETSRHTNQYGFTLIEVVIALLVLGLSLTAATQLASNSTDDVRHLTRITYAHWVAMNRLNQLELQADLPSTGVSSGESQQANLTLYWQQAVSDTQITGLRQVEILVRAEPAGGILASVRGVLGKALAQGQNTMRPGLP